MQADYPNVTQNRMAGLDLGQDFSFKQQVACPKVGCLFFAPIRLTLRQWEGRGTQSWGESACRSRYSQKGAAEPALCSSSSSSGAAEAVSRHFLPRSLEPGTGIRISPGRGGGEGSGLALHSLPPPPPPPPGGGGAGGQTPPTPPPSMIGGPGAPRALIGEGTHIFQRSGSASCKQILLWNFFVCFSVE